MNFNKICENFAQFSFNIEFNFLKFDSWQKLSHLKLLVELSNAPWNYLESNKFQQARKIRNPVRMKCQKLVKNLHPTPNCTIFFKTKTQTYSEMSKKGNCLIWIDFTQIWVIWKSFTHFLLNSRWNSLQFDSWLNNSFLSRFGFGEN